MTSDLPLLAYLGTFQFLSDSRDMMNKGVKQVAIPKQIWSISHIKNQWPGAVFKVPDLFQWIVVATSSKHIEDLYKAPDNVLSSMKAIDEVSSIYESCSVCKIAH